MKKIFTLKIIIIGLFLVVSFFITPLTKDAQAVEYQDYPERGWEVIPKECLDPNTTDKNDTIIRCDVNSFVQLFVNLAYIMLKLAPPLAMIIVIYGGFRFITARGKQEDVQTGKKILGAAFFGMLIIIGLGWALTFFVVQTLTGGWEKGKSTELFQKTANITSKEWWTGGSNNNNDDNNMDLQCCVIADRGCVMKTESECTELGGKNAEGTCTDGTAKAQCADINSRFDCCKSPDADGNGKPDVCVDVGDSMNTCFDYPDYQPIKSCWVIVCDYAYKI